MEQGKIARMRIVRWFFGLLILAALAFGVAYYFAGTADGPAITINQPSVIGQGGTLDVTIDAPGGELTALEHSAAAKGPHHSACSTWHRLLRGLSSEKAIASA